MASSMADDIAILVIFICLILFNGVRLTTLALFTDVQQNYYADCSWNIIKYSALKDLTLVNVKDSNFIKDLQLINIKTLTRTFLATNLNEPNIAYAVQCDTLSECINGLDDLVKDRYWNPNATFFVTARNLNRGQELFFRKLHRLYVFKTVLVLYDRIYFYDFEVSDQCTFTAKAITDYECKSLTSNNAFNIWADIKGALEEKPKTPYSECNITILVNILVPFVFPPLNKTNEPIGYEEEFITILKRMNFTRIQFLYNTNMTTTGEVCEDFTVTGVLRDVQAGVVDYILGGALLSHYRLQVFDFTYPHWSDDLLLIVPKARQIDKWEVMYTVFQPLVWGLILVAFAGVTLVAFGLKANRKRNMYGLILTTLDVYSYFTNNAPKKSASYIMLSWALFAWLITCFYQSDLASVFTKPAYYREINSLNEILNRNFKFYLSTAKYDYLKGSEELDMGGLVLNSTLCKTDYRCLQAVAYERRKYTLVSRIGYLYLEVEFHKEDGEPRLHRIVKPYFNIFRTGYLRKGDPNLKRIRFLERQIIAFGFHRRSLLTYIHLNKLKHYKVKKSHSKPLSCSDITGLYYIFMCGCGISLVAFFVEVVVNKAGLTQQN